MRRNLQILALLTASVFVFTASAARAQAPEPQSPNAQQQQAPLDPILQLNLTPEQRQKIREIREQTKAERVAINQRLRETNQALEAALDADSPDDAIVEQRVRDAAAAQAASMRMRISTEVKIRRVLSPEQLVTLRALRQQAREARRDRVLDDNQRRIENQRNGMAPFFQRRGLQRRQRP